MYDQSGSRMLWYVRLLVLITLVRATSGVLVVGPKFVRSNQAYPVVISNFKQIGSKVNLMLRLEAHNGNGTLVFNLREQVDVRRNMNRIVNFAIPTITSPINIKLTIDGQRGFSFHDEVPIVFLTQSMSGLIQIDKPVFNPRDTVRFRAIMLDTELKPPARVKAVDVIICDSEENVIRRWSSAKLYAGVFESELQISPSPMLGMWSISVQVEGEVLVSKTFEVKEYVLSSFDVEVLPTVIPLEEHQGLSLTVAANYHFGKPVKGRAKLELYMEDDTLDQAKTIEVYGTGQVHFRFTEELVLHYDQQDVRVKTTFVEDLTDRTVTKETNIAVYKHFYRVKFEKASEQFHAGIPFKCNLKLSYHDGSPASYVRMLVEIAGTDVDHEEVYTTDREGTIKLVMQPTESTEEMEITVSETDSDFSVRELIHKSETNTYIKLELKSTIKINGLIKLLLTCNKKLTFFFYYVVARGTIIDAGFLRPNRQVKYYFQINASEKMIPKATIFVATVSNDTVVWDSVELSLNQLSNSLDMRIDATEMKPGSEIELQLKGRPKAYVWLAAYDQGLVQFSSKHDLFWQDVIKVFDDFHAVKQDEYDAFHSMGLFARIASGTQMEPRNAATMRFGSDFMRPISKLVAYRTNFPESWLWQNVTIGRSGTYKIIESVPDTITSWYLTAFSIDPVYGLGIIKKPIQFTTVQPFYIVESLPYSIKRGEAVVLQFTLFNNLGGEYIADVTLYNVANQTEFIGRPVEDLSYTKSVSVPPKVGVPISFLVKARKLGEMAVRVKASIMLGMETDALEKVIRVMPESLEQKKMESRLFFADVYTDQTFNIHLDVSKKADNGSNKIEFRVDPNLLTSVLDNLDNLLSVPSGSGEQNMINFVPNIVVLDYMHAISSKEQSLMDKATNLLRQGYQNQMRYRQADGSFAVWQNATGSVFLTAFVAKSMQTASKYISEVDVAMVEKAYDWLASKQHSSGRFDEIGSVIHQDMQGGLRNGIALTSFVTTALLEHQNSKLKHAVVIQKALNYLSSRMATINDPYDLSIATYAFLLNGHVMKDEALKRLIDMSTVSINGMERYWETTNRIEATAYALLSFVIAEKYVEGIPVMRWLVNQRDATGSFPRTQDTFVGLRALTKLAEKISPSRNDYSIQLKYKTSMKHFRITSQNINVQNYVDIPADTKSLEINVGGIGFGLLQVIYQYHLNLVNFENRFKLILEKKNTKYDYELRLKVSVRFISRLSHSYSNMVMVEVTFPSGYVVDRNPISEQTYINPIQHTEIRYGGTSVVVYYNKMGSEWNYFTVTAYRRFKVALQRPAYVVVYDSVNPDWNAIQPYEADNLNVCEICDGANCPQNCKK